MKRLCEKLTGQLRVEARKLATDLTETPDDAPALDEANLLLRDCLATVRKIRLSLEHAREVTP